MMVETVTKFEDTATNGDCKERDLCYPPKVVIIPKENMVPFGQSHETSCTV